MTRSLRPFVAGSALLALAASGCASSAQAPGPLDVTALDAATIPSLQTDFAANRFTAVDLTKAYLQRIATVDPALNAVTAVAPDAVAQAQAADDRRRAGRSLGPMDGIPVLIKDNVDTVAQPATAGSRALVGVPAPRDAFVVTRLRAAGAVILGKTNLSEWANFRSLHSTSGWSGVGGQTHNPYVLDRNPCGSSSGSGAGVAASLAQVAVGTETDGSIVCPAGANGVVGLKPTLGAISRTVIVPISAEQDTAGPLARHVVDAAIAADAMTGRDPDDSATAEFRPGSWADGLAGASLRGRRIGVWRLQGKDAGTDAVTGSAVAAMRAAGAEVVDVTPDAGDAGDLETKALHSEFRRDLEAYLAQRGGTHRTLADLIAFNRADPVELSKFDQSLFELCAAAPPTDAPEIVEARAKARTQARAAIDDTLARYRLDAIAAPTNSPAWVTSYDGDDFKVSSSSLAAIAGYPNVTVPAGFAGELPVGLSLMGGRWRDVDLLRVAVGFEAATHARRMPTYRPTLN